MQSFSIALSSDPRLSNRFYVKAIETGAFDFLVPLLLSTDLASVVLSAHENVVTRGKARLPVARAA